MICERLGVKFPGPIRPSGKVARAELRAHLATERVRVTTLRLKSNSSESYFQPLTPLKALQRKNRSALPCLRPCRVSTLETRKHTQPS
jgi:hypothetical protein